jgi:hypothetical protein
LIVPLERSYIVVRYVRIALSYDGLESKSVLLLTTVSKKITTTASKKVFTAVSGHHLTGSMLPYLLLQLRQINLGRLRSPSDVSIHSIWGVGIPLNYFPL